MAAGILIDLQPNETILKDGPANHFKGVEAVGGRLFLTNQRVFFKSHAFNVQNHSLSIPLDSIQSMGKRNTLLLVPNGMYIETVTGEREKFVIWGRGDWIAKTMQQKEKNL